MLGQLLDDVLPEVVEHPADTDPGVLAGSADEGVDAQAEGADLGLRGQLGHGLELALGGRRRRVPRGLRGGVEALGEAADDVDRGGELLTAQRSGFSAAMS